MQVDIFFKALEKNRRLIIEIIEQAAKISSVSGESFNSVLEQMLELVGIFSQLQNYENALHDITTSRDNWRDEYYKAKALEGVAESKYRKIKHEFDMLNIRNAALSVAVGDLNKKLDTKE